MSSEALKIKLIHKNLSFEDVDQPKAFDEVSSNTEAGKNKLNALVKPIREKFDIEAIKKEQNYMPINAAQFFKELEDLKIEEPLEDLFKMI